MISTIKRIQRDYSLAFKLAVVDKVGEMLACVELVNKVI
ncbi:hypothetical protein Sbal117_0768 [Shewanella baltica OS117]|nr:hypothetical protein Sbal117_0768 [Shewanella baltica OS117]